VYLSRLDRMDLGPIAPAGLLPMPGEVYSYRGWWLSEAMEAVLDTMTEWRREKYPENEHHSTCLFTWESIAANSNNFEGYRSEYG
jgi:hypothetical protein